MTSFQELYETSSINVAIAKINLAIDEKQTGPSARTLIIIKIYKLQFT